MKKKKYIYNISMFYSYTCILIFKKHALQIIHKYFYEFDPISIIFPSLTLSIKFNNKYMGVSSTTLLINDQDKLSI